MPPRAIFSKIPCPEIGTIHIIGKDCQPKLELFEVTEKPSFIHSFKKERESVPLSKDGKYRLILVNDSDDPDTVWNFGFKIEWRLGRKRRTLMKNDESGQGQVFINRDFHFQIVAE